MLFKHLVFPTFVLLSLALSGIGSGQIIIGETQTASSPDDDNPAVSLDLETTTTLGSVVVVFIAFQDYNSISLDSVTLEGAPMTEGVALFSEGDIQGAFYYLPVAHKGVSTVSVTASNPTGNKRGMTVHAMVLYNVDTSTPPSVAHGTVASNSSTTQIDLTPPVTATDSLALAFGMTDSGLSAVEVTSDFFEFIQTNLPNSSFSATATITEEDPLINLSLVDTRDGLGDSAVAMVVVLSPAPETDQPGGAVIELG